jgi:hypothetical protein
MCKVAIKDWYGRLGNNLLQLAHASYFAFEQNNASTVTFPNHKHLERCFIINKDLNSKSCQCSRLLEYHDNMFFFNFDELDWYKRKCLVQKYVNDILNFSIKENINIVKTDCVVHIRSGDVRNDFTSKFYRGKPFKFYFNAIEHFLAMNKNVLIVYEDQYIDVFSQLKNTYKKNSKIEFQSSSIENDLNSLIRCEHFLFSRGTFELMAYCLSKTMKHFYVSELEKMNVHNWGSDPEVKIHTIKEL